MCGIRKNYNNGNGCNCNLGVLFFINIRMIHE